MHPEYGTLGSMSSSEIVEKMKRIDVFVTTYGDDTVFLLFMVPYSVLVEVQPDYFHDSTTSIIAYASDIYPVVVRDVYSDVPGVCRRDGELVLSEEEPCRSALRNRDIEFDIKSMTQSMAQAQYYLYNYKMKELEYWGVCSNKQAKKKKAKKKKRKDGRGVSPTARSLDRPGNWRGCDGEWRSPGWLRRWRGNS